MKIHREEGGTLQSVRQIGTMAFAAAVMAFATGLSHASPIWEANFDQGTNLFLPLSDLCVPQIGLLLQPLRKRSFYRVR